MIKSTISRELFAADDMCADVCVHDKKRRKSGMDNVAIAQVVLSKNMFLLYDIAVRHYAMRKHVEQRPIRKSSRSSPLRVAAYCRVGADTS